MERALKKMAMKICTNVFKLYVQGNGKVVIVRKLPKCSFLCFARQR